MRSRALLPENPTLTAPAVSNVKPYPEMATDSAVFTWTANDPQASLAKMRGAQVDATSSFEWSVYAPASLGTYKMVSLPADLATLPFAVKDKDAYIEVESVSMDTIVGGQDFYTRNRGIYIPQEISEMKAPTGRVLIK